MAKRQTMETPETPDTNSFADDVAEMERGVSPDDIMSDGMDFSLSDEYKPTPLVPKARYSGNVVGVAYNKAKKCITWKVVLDGNENSICSDGETSVDGIQLVYNNWLPKPGDEHEITKDGKLTKRQSKINMMKDFADNMKINMDSPTVIAEAISDGSWVGIRVLIDVNVSEYQGRVRNEISTMLASE